MAATEAKALATRRPPRGAGREALIEAARELIDEQGLKGISYRTVADRAGVAHGLVRHHFATLDELVRVAVHRAASASIIGSLLEPGTGRIEDFAAGLADDLNQHPNSHAMSYELAVEGRRREGMGAEMRSIYADYLGSVEREFARIGLAPDWALVRVVFAALDGLVLQQLVTETPGALESGIERLHELLRQVLAAQQLATPFTGDQKE